MSLEQVFQFTGHVALARVQATIEQAAYDAYLAMGYSNHVQAAALKQLERAQATQASFEASLLDLQRKSQEHRAQGIDPFDAKLWRQRCQLTAQSLCTPSLSPNQRYFIEENLATATRAVAREYQLQARAVYQEVLSEMRGLGPFEPNLFDAACAVASRAAAEGCGQSDILWSTRATSAMNRLLAKIAPEHLEEAQSIAHKWGWMTPQEEQESQELVEDLGLCSHGLDPDCCPAGCGE